MNHSPLKGHSAIKRHGIGLYIRGVSRLLVFREFSCFNVSSTCVSVSRKDSSSLEDDLRSRIKGILYCDMTQPNSLFPSMYPPFDAISSSLCLDVVPSGTLAGYQAAAKNITSLLRPGGSLVLVGTLGCHFYRFGQCQYPVIPMTPSNLKQIWTDIGFKVKVWKQYDMTEADLAVNQSSDSKGMFCMVAKKEK